MYKRRFPIIIVLLFVSLACSTSQCTEWYKDSDEDDSYDKMCDDGLLFDYDIYCDEHSSPKINNFSGKIFNNTDQYIHDVAFKVKFYGVAPEASCSFNFDEIAPGETVEAVCQVTADICLRLAHPSGESCKYASYPEHLDWLATQDAEGSGEDIIEGAAGNDEIIGDDEVTLEDLMPVLQPVINGVRQEWANKAAEHPCQPEEAQSAYQAWVDEKASTLSDDSGGLVGEGMPWATLEAFRDWLVAEAHPDGPEAVIKTWQGNFDITNTALEICQACVPPTLIGTIHLHVNLATCELEGEISAAGDGQVTINDCINDQPIAATCTSHGTMYFSGDISGTVSETGELELDQTYVTTDFSSGWIEGCDWAGHEVDEYHWEKDPVSLSGSLDWQGPASGTFQYASTVCSLDGTWTVTAE